MEDSFTFVYLLWGCSTTWNKRCFRWGWQYHFYRKNLKGVHDYIYGTSLFSWRVEELLSNDERAVHSGSYANIARSSVFLHYSLKLVRLIHCSNVAVRYFSHLPDRGLVLCLEAWGSAMLNLISRLGETRPEQEWSKWNGIFRYGLFRFSGILGQPREVHPKFRNEIPENICSMRSPTRSFRNFWSNGKRPWS